MITFAVHSGYNITLHYITSLHSIMYHPSFPLRETYQIKSHINIINVTWWNKYEYLFHIIKDNL